MYLTVRMKDGRGFIISEHDGHWYFGDTKDDKKGLVTRYKPLESLDVGLDHARNLCRAWRGRGIELKSQWCAP
jgi:hypothetical protein